MRYRGLLLRMWAVLMCAAVIVGAVAAPVIEEKYGSWASLWALGLSLGLCDAAIVCGVVICLRDSK